MYTIKEKVVMKNEIRRYNGAVFFVDILGFSALTKGQIKDITVSDFEAWGLNSENEQNNSCFSNYSKRHRGLERLSWYSICN